MSSQQLEPPKQSQVTELTQEKDSLWLKVFLIDSSTNQNDWKASEEYIRKNVSKFVGKPFILTSDKNHPDFVREGVVFGKGQETLDQILTAQSKYKIGEIKKVEASSESPSQYHAYIQITEPKIIDSFKKGHIPRFVSPSVFDPNGTEDGAKMQEFEPLHIAAVDEPAYGVKAYVRGACDGESTKCLNELKSASSGSTNTNYVFTTSTLTGKTLTLPNLTDNETVGAPTTTCPCSILETFTNKYSSSYLKNASLTQDSLSTTTQLEKPETIIAEITPQPQQTNNDTTNQQTPSLTNTPTTTTEVPQSTTPQVEAPQTPEKRGRKSTVELENTVEELKAQLQQIADWRKTEEEKAVKKAAEEQRATIESSITPEVVGGDEEKRRQVVDFLISLNVSNEQLPTLLDLITNSSSQAREAAASKNKKNEQVRSASVNTLILNQNSPQKEKSSYFSSGFFGDL